MPPCHLLRQDTFVSESFAVLKERKVFLAMVPRDLGGGGISHRALGQGLRTLARPCGSTAFSFSMHQHLIVAKAALATGEKALECLGVPGFTGPPMSSAW